MLIVDRGFIQCCTKKKMQNIPQFELLHLLNANFNTKQKKQSTVGKAY